MEFHPCNGCVHTSVWMHHMDADETYREKVKRELHNNATGNIDQILTATAVLPVTSYLISIQI